MCVVLKLLTPQPDAPGPSEAPQHQGLSHTSTTTTSTSLASGTGRTTRVTHETKAQQTAWPEDKAAASAPCDVCDAVLKVLCTDASSQSTVSSMLAVPTKSSPPSVKPFAPSRSIPSAPNTLTTVPKGVDASKAAKQEFRAAASSRSAAAPTVDKRQRKSHATPRPQPAAASTSSAHPLSKPPGQPSAGGTEQGLKSVSLTTLVYGTPSVPPKRTPGMRAVAAAAVPAKGKSSHKNQPVVGECSDSLWVLNIVLNAGRPLVRNADP